MSRKTEEYPAQVDEAEHPIYTLKWSSQSELSHRVIDRIQTDHPELFDKMIKQAESPASHPRVSWVTQNSEQENEYNYRLDAESDAGKIFLSFQRAMSDTPSTETWEPAEAVTEYLIRPLHDVAAHIERSHHENRENPAFNLKETIQWRLGDLGYDLTGALTSNNDNKFLEEIKNLKWLSNDLTSVHTPGADKNDFNHQLFMENDHLFNELQKARDRTTYTTDASWLSDDENHSANDAFQTFQKAMQDQSPQYRQMTAETLTNALRGPVDFSTQDLTHQESSAHSDRAERFIDPQQYDEMMRHAGNFFQERSWGIADAIEAALLKDDHSAYQEAMTGLKDLNHQIQRALQEGYTPQGHTNTDQTNADADPTNTLQFDMEQASRERGASLNYDLLEYTDGIMPNPEDVTFEKWTQNPEFESMLKAFMTQMIPGDRERLAENITAKSQDTDKDPIRKRLNAIVTEMNDNP